MPATYYWKTRKLYAIQFLRDGKIVTWERWATDAQEARESAMRALEQECPAEECEIVSIEKARGRYGLRG